MRQLLNYPVESIALLLILLVCLFITFIDWRKGVFLLLIWLYLEDPIRKFIPGRAPWLIVAKVPFIIFIYFSFFVVTQLNEKRELWRSPILTPLLIFATICIAQSFNPKIPMWQIPIIGLLFYIVYVPFLYLGYYMFDNKDSLLRFCSLYILIAIPLCILSFSELVDATNVSILQELTKTFEHEFRSSAYGVVPLSSSIFRSADQFAKHMMILFFIGLGSYNSTQRTRFHFLSIIAALTGLIISNRRGQLYVTTPGLVCFFSLLVYKATKYREIQKSYTRFLTKIPLLVIVVLLALYLFNFSFFQSSVLQFQVESAYESMSIRGPRVFSTIANAYNAVGLWGLGTGMQSQGVQYAGFDPREYGSLIVEYGLGKIWVELGVIGFIVYIWLIISVVLIGFKAMNQCNSRDLYTLGVGLFLFVVLMIILSMKGHQILSDASMQFHFWFLLGVLLRLPSFELSSTEEVIEEA